MAPESVQRWLYASTLSAYFGLIILLLLWPIYFSPPQAMPIALMLLISLTPLVIFLFGVLHQRPKPLVWVAFFSLLYFIHGVSDAWVAEGVVQWLGLSETLLSCWLFISATWLARQSALSQPTETEE
ncbi:MAG: DUF2069 domain-containing protein [gamma proteobacterium symbiont of Bathyaustriella thionipta]|nr:DUF2069 domain-containing protein [gamma proteobacterium symbiont of Bathyaustriella thionipta]